MSPTTARSRTLRLPVAALALLAAPGPSALAALELEPITLDLWVHVLASDESRAVDCDMSDAAVRALFRRANGYWGQAGVHWNVTAIQHRRVTDCAELDALVFADYATEEERNAAQAAARRIHARMLPEDGWLVGGLDVVLVEDFGQLGAAYYGAGRIVLGANGLIAGPGAHGPTPPVILAHELGHALGLPHAPCEQVDNFMLGRCTSRDGSEDALSRAQIGAARKRATYFADRQRAGVLHR